MPDNASNKPPKFTVGWREYVALPGLGIKRVRAKIDSGARSSAIDAASIEELSGDRVRLTLVVDRRHPDRRITIEAPIARRSRVKSAHGTVHERLFITTTMRLGPVEKEIELGVVCRKRMLCRMLVGRKALEPEFVIDPARRYVLSGKRKRKKS